MTSTRASAAAWERAGKAQLPRAAWDAFISICRSQAREPGDVIEALVALYIDTGGDVTGPPRPLDTALANYMDWCIGGPAAAPAAVEARPPAKRARKRRPPQPRGA